jgi:lysozyme
MLTFTLERHQEIVDAINDRAAGKGFLAHAAIPMVFGIDVSHWQGSIDFRKVKAAGFSYVVIKATEGTGYTDVNFRTYRSQAHAAGLVVLMYHYVGSSSAKRVYDANAELNYFASVVGPLAVGEGIALDYEPLSPPADPVGWCRTWLSGAQARLGASPWIYMNSSTEARYNWSNGVSGSWGLWLAKYDNDPDMDPVVHWPSLTGEQYYDKGVAPGVSGGVDVDVFYGTINQLLAFCKGGTPTPKPAPQEDDMPGYTQWSQPDKDALLNDIRNATWGSPLDGAGNIKNGEPWASTRLSGVDGKTGDIEAKVDGIAVDVAKLKLGGVDVDALTEGVVEKLYTRLKD